MPQNTVSLLTAAVRQESSQPSAFTVVSPAQKAYLLQAENEADMREWISAIQVLAHAAVLCEQCSQPQCWQHNA